MYMKLLSSTTNPKPKGQHPIACSGKPNLSMWQSHLCVALLLQKDANLVY